VLSWRFLAEGLFLATQLAALFSNRCGLSATMAPPRIGILFATCRADVTLPAQVTRRSDGGMSWMLVTEKLEYLAVAHSAEPHFQSWAVSRSCGARQAVRSFVPNFAPTTPRKRFSSADDRISMIATVCMSDEFLAHTGDGAT